MADLSRIQFKRTSTKGRKPDAGTMNPGELAINLADQYLLTKNDSGTIINLSCPPVYDRDVIMNGRVNGNNYILGRTANYLDDPNSRDLDKFGAFRTNNMDGFLALTLHVPHATTGIKHARGFTFDYGHTGSRVETYGYNANGERAFSYKVYHEGDKPTPAEIGTYTKTEIDKMFIKNVKMSVPSGGSTRGYFKIATAMIPQNGRMVMLRIYGGNGYNVNSYDQVDFLEIVVRGGNNNPKGVSIAAYRRNSLNVHEVFAINTSGDNYDIYVNYGRYTDNVIVEFGKTVDVALTVHDVPAFSATKPTGTKFDARVITMFNTENKAGTLMFDNNSQATYDIVSLNNVPDNNKKYMRKFRSRAAETIWHETVQGDVYRLATGSTDQKEVLKIIGSDGLFVDRLHLQGNNAIRMWRPTGRSNYFEYMDQRDGANKRQGWFGFGSTDTNDFQWYSDEGKNFVKLEASGQVSLSVGATKIVYSNGQYVSADSNAYRMIFGNYGAFWRNDGGKVYLLSTAENDKFGGWNTYRPFIYDLTSGNVQLGGDGNEAVLTVERASKAARFSGNTYIKGQYLTFDAGAGQSRDYFRFNHWGDSNNARDNILYLEDSKGRHFSTERNMATGALKADFLGDLEVGGKLTWGKGTATSSFNIRAWGSDSRKQVFECADESGWHFYTQRAGGPGTNEIIFNVNGKVQSQGVETSGNVKITGPDIEFRRSGNKHLWFRDPNGLELGLIYCDDNGVIRFRGQKQTQDWIFANKMIQLGTGGTVSGGDKGIIRGQVQGGAWTQWKDRAAGLLVDCQQSENSAHNIWKATHWGKYHLAAMGVHASGGSVANTIVRMHVNDATFDFAASGDFQAGRNGNFNDVYIRSDARLKINKEEYKENATDKVNRLKVYSYDKVKSLTDRTVIAHEVGIIAQDLEKELPEAVTTSKIGDPDKPEEILTISNSAVNALLIKAFQEMSEELKAVKAELSAMKSGK